MGLVRKKKNPRVFLKKKTSSLARFESSNMPCKCKYKSSGLQSSTKYFCGTGYCDCRKKNRACGPGCACFGKEGCECRNRLGTHASEEIPQPLFVQEKPQEEYHPPRSPKRAKRSQEAIEDRLLSIEDKIDSLTKIQLQYLQAVEMNEFNQDMTDALRELY